MKKLSTFNDVNPPGVPTAYKKRKVNPLFETGQVFIERRVLDTFSLAAIDELLADHVECETGPCSDWQQIHEVCLRDRGPVFSMFRDDLNHEGFIMTDPDRSRTTMMMGRA